MLGTGYYLHTCAVPILRNAKHPEKNTRNLFTGYTIVFISYIIIGGLGYIAFISTTFRNYFIRNFKGLHSGEIDQNCMNMLSYTDGIAFVCRLSIFMLLFSTYPMLNLFMRTHLLNLLFSNKEVDQRHLVVLNILVTLIPLNFAIFYPEIGTILAFSGAFAGFVIVYCLPVMVYLKRKYTRITNPLLAEAIALNEFRVVTSKETSAKRSITSTNDNSCYISRQASNYNKQNRQSG